MRKPPPDTIECIDQDETKLLEVHKHIIGLVSIYFQALIGFIAVTILALLVFPALIKDPDTAVSVVVIFVMLMFVFFALVTFLASYIYRQNRIIITDRNITQTLQYGLFSRKVSQLNVVDVEDVTSVQSGFIATMFNYGILKIETAGEQSNFYFDYCPNSGRVAKVVLDAREKMLGQMEDDDSPPRHGHNAPKRHTAHNPKKTMHEHVVTHESDADKAARLNKSKDTDVRNIGAEIVTHASRIGPE